MTGIAEPGLDSEWLSPREATKVIPYSTNTLAQFRWLGKGSAYFRCGRKILYRRSDLERFIAQGRVEPRA